MELQAGKAGLQVPQGSWSSERSEGASWSSERSEGAQRRSCWSCDLRRQVALGNRRLKCMCGINGPAVSILRKRMPAKRKRSGARSAGLSAAIAVFLSALMTSVVVIIVLLIGDRTRNLGAESASEPGARGEVGESGADGSGTEGASEARIRSDDDDDDVDAAAAADQGCRAIPGVEVFGSCCAVEGGMPGSLSDDVPARYPSVWPWSEYRRRLTSAYRSSRAAGWEETLDSALLSLSPECIKK
jgi:hypothetical protein